MASVAPRKWTYKGVEKSAWVVRYKDPTTGQHRSKQFDKKKDADRFRIKTEAEISSGQHIADTATLTVRRAADSYVEHCEVRHMEGQIGRIHLDHQRHYLGKHLPGWFATKLLTDIKWADVERLNTELLTTSGLMSSSVKKFMVIVSAVFDLAKRRGQVRENSVAEFRKAHRGGAKRVMRSFSVEDVSALLQAASVRRWKGHERVRRLMEIAVNLAAFTGMRHGEILALKWEKIDFERGLIHVHHNLTRYDELKGPKTKSGKRDVPLPKHVAVMLEEWRPYVVEEERGLILRAARGYSVNGKGVWQAPWAAGNFGKVWHALLKDAGLNGKDREGRVYRFHDLRHFAASMMIEQGVPLMEVASILGHSHFDTTLQIYAHQTRRGSHRHDIVERMVEITKPALILSPVTQELRTSA